LHQLMEIIEGFTVNKIYGELVIKFEAGKIVIIRKTESVKVN